MKIIFESKEYYDAIYEVQMRIRNRLKWTTLTIEEETLLEWVADMICEEMNGRNLHHYWNPEDEY